MPFKCQRILFTAVRCAAPVFALMAALAAYARSGRVAVAADSRFPTIDWWKLDFRGRLTPSSFLNFTACSALFTPYTWRLVSILLLIKKDSFLLCLELRCLRYRTAHPWPLSCSPSWCCCQSIHDFCWFWNQNQIILHGLVVLGRQSWVLFLLLCVTHTQSIKYFSDNYRQSRQSTHCAERLNLSTWESSTDQQHTQPGRLGPDRMAQTHTSLMDSKANVLHKTCKSLILIPRSEAAVIWTQMQD